MVIKALQIRHVEVRCVGAPPRDRVARASGVSGVTADGQVLRCTVTGSTQPFLEALQGTEVVDLVSLDPARPVSSGATSTHISGEEP